MFGAELRLVKDFETPRVRLSLAIRPYGGANHSHLAIGRGFDDGLRA
jgi:hypothetical protein